MDKSHNGGTESKGMDKGDANNKITAETIDIDMSDWADYFGKNSKTRYQVVASPGMEGLARRIAQLHPRRFLYHQTKWNKFPDGTDNIEVGGFQPVNRIAGQHVLLLASFHNNDVTLSQFSVMITLLQSFIESLTVVLPFYPVGTMERVIQEGQVATANSYAQMFSNLPSCGKPTRLIIYDLHTLQNRFYLHGNAIASLQTSIPLLINRIQQQQQQQQSSSSSSSNDTGGGGSSSSSQQQGPQREAPIDCIAFPDDGAAKRFSFMFAGRGYEIVTCGKTRDGDKRLVTIQDGDPSGKNVIIVDDLVQTGGTLYECGVALRAAGATGVSAFVAHAVFPNQSWRRFTRGGDRACFEKFLVTNSIPTVTDTLPDKDVFEVLDISEKIVEDLDKYS
eukprot:CAMPEP_0174971276 /NCGR_PEP_ID=MMETSP0004_2-20121128/9892_1 /TAXON_ID=420556 /ORGANISM="Ochromonas sp., Strain CCMP1393" /LENGTH=391 /DNA_ID=CAMNT_0016221187 /DNA_START=182 /DNA_END=1357 /DNA_ORIENTATION=-